MGKWPPNRDCCIFVSSHPSRFVMVVARKQPIITGTILDCTKSTVLQFFSQFGYYTPFSLRFGLLGMIRSQNRKILRSRPRSWQPSHLVCFWIYGNSNIFWMNWFCKTNSKNQLTRPKAPKYCFMLESILETTNLLNIISTPLKSILKSGTKHVYGWFCLAMQWKNLILTKNKVNLK